MLENIFFRIFLILHQNNLLNLQVKKMIFILY